MGNNIVRKTKVRDENASVSGDGTPGNPKKVRREALSTRFVQTSRDRTVVSVTLPRDLIRDLDRYVANNNIQSRTQLVEDLVRDEIYPEK